MAPNKKQKAIICVGGLLLILMFLFPPWQGNLRANFICDAGYHFFTSPPSNIVTGKERPKSLKDMLSGEQLKVAKFKIDKYISKNPDLDRKVLKAGFIQYLENLQAGMPDSGKPVTVDNIEQLGRKRLARTTRDGYLLNLAHISNVEINYQRLIIQCAIVVIAALAGLFVAAGKK